MRPDQLGRSLGAPAPPPRWRAWLGAALAIGSVLGGTKAAAQTNLGSYNGGLVPAPPSPATPTERAHEQAAPGGLTVLRGFVTDAATQEGLPGVTMMLAGTTTGTATNAAGGFALPVGSNLTRLSVDGPAPAAARVLT